MSFQDLIGGLKVAIGHQILAPGEHEELRLEIREDALNHVIQMRAKVGKVYFKGFR